MTNQNLKQGSLSRLLGKYFFLYFSLLFMACLLGHMISDFFSSRPFDTDNISSSWLYAFLASVITTLFYWDMFKDIFKFLNNDKIDVPSSHEYSKISKTISSFQIDCLVSELEDLDLLLTYINPVKNSIKVREKLVSFAGCGAVLHFDQNTDTLTITSFSLADSILNDQSKRVHKFNQKLYNFPKIQLG